MSRNRDKIFDNVWQAFVEACGGGCVMCGRNNRPLDKGHIVPYRHGGPDGLENRQPLCAPCNGSESYKKPMRDYRPADWRENFIMCLAKHLGVYGKGK